MATGQWPALSGDLNRFADPLTQRHRRHARSSYRLPSPVQSSGRSHSRIRARGLTTHPSRQPSKQPRATRGGLSGDSLIPLAMGLLAFTVTILAADSNMVGAARDDGLYALIARALAQGDGFHWIHLPGKPAATHFPPLYP